MTPAMTELLRAAEAMLDRFEVRCGCGRPATHEICHWSGSTFSCAEHAEPPAVPTLLSHSKQDVIPFQQANASIALRAAIAEAKLET